MSTPQCGVSWKLIEQGVLKSAFRRFIAFVVRVILAGHLGENNGDASEASSADGNVGHGGKGPGVGGNVVDFRVGEEGRFAVMTRDDDNLIIHARYA